MEGFSNWIKIEGMVSFYSSSGNSEQFKKSLGQGHTHTLTHAYQLLGQKPGVHWPSKPAWFENASIHKKYVQNY